MLDVLLDADHQDPEEKSQQDQLIACGRSVSTKAIRRSPSAPVPKKGLISGQTRGKRLGTRRPARASQHESASAN
jgi:hypothetical protein